MIDSFWEENGRRVSRLHSTTAPIFRVIECLKPSEFLGEGLGKEVILQVSLQTRAGPFRAPSRQATAPDFISADISSPLSRIRDRNRASGQKNLNLGSTAMYIRHGSPSIIALSSRGIRSPLDFRPGALKGRRARWASVAGHTGSFQIDRRVNQYSFGRRRPKGKGRTSGIVDHRAGGFFSAWQHFDRTQAPAATVCFSYEDG